MIHNLNESPRITLPGFERWLERQSPDHLLIPLTYLYCVDGCRADETAQRFEMTATAAASAGRDKEEVAQWHRSCGELWEGAPDRFRELAFRSVRQLRASTTVLQFMSDIEPRDAEYLIEPYLPLGMLTVLGGVSGVGKTWLALAWAAKVSRAFAVDEPGAVYYFTQENDPAVVLQPRLEALGADLSRVAIQRFSPGAAGLTLNDRRLEAAAEAVPPKLVIFDPIQSYLGARVEMNKANEVRPILDWLGRFAQTYDCAVVLVSHMSKPNLNSSDALDRLLGSSDFRNAARSIVIVGCDPEEPDVRVFAHAKNSLGPAGASQRYTVGEDGVSWLGECALTANEIIRPAPKSAGRPAASREAAADALRALMQPKGWATSEEVQALCTAKGISMTTLRRVKKEMEIHVLRSGSKSTLRTWWVMPGVADGSVMEAS